MEPTANSMTAYLTQTQIALAMAGRALSVSRKYNTMAMCHLTLEIERIVERLHDGRYGAAASLPTLTKLAGFVLELA